MLGAAENHTIRLGSTIYQNWRRMPVPIVSVFVLFATFSALCRLIANMPNRKHQNCLKDRRPMVPIMPEPITCRKQSGDSQEARSLSPAQPCVRRFCPSLHLFSAWIYSKSRANPRINAMCTVNPGDFPGVAILVTTTEGPDVVELEVAVPAATVHQDVVLSVSVGAGAK
jgi:hypothetical protein